MEGLNGTLELLNPWWKDGTIGKELAKPYKRRAFDRVLELMDYRQIIIVSGLRRVGKTTLLYQVIDHLLENHDRLHMVYFSFDKGAEDISQILETYGEMTGTDWKKEKVFVFLDEIVKLEGWADKIKLLYDALPNLKLLVSSSSSILLEEEAVKSLAGRYFLTGLKPLSFTEYLELKGRAEYLKRPGLWEKEIKREVNAYLLRSFPETVEWDDEPIIKDYLRTTIMDKVIRVDLQDRFKNVNRDLLLNLIEIFYSEPGMYVNYDRMSRKLGVSKKTLISHIRYLESAYLIRRIRNFRPNAFTTSRKLQRIYAYWWTLALCHTDDRDMIMENLVASSMDAAYYWRKNGKEVDFLQVQENEITPVEVKNRKGIRKEHLDNLGYFLKKYNAKKGLLIYNGAEDKKEGIDLVPLWKWLLSLD